MKVYVVSVGKYVSFVSTNRSTAEEYAVDKALKYTSADEIKWEPSGFPGDDELTFLNTNTGRRNKSRYTITTMDLN